MDKVLSSRIDESIIQQIGILADELGTTKKSVIESAIKLYAEQTKMSEKTDAFSRTSGTWLRSESPEESIKNARAAFNKSMNRHHS
ncbi:MAG: hypothetical protein MAG581_01126 [Deltaproteobacteria bacterium]|jgi:hypothetical protein|nr:hypothetical protein [Deltaproteobacteria bacterium]